MTYYNSPKAVVKESEAGVGVVETGDSIAAVVMMAPWGPVESPYLTTGGEAEIVKRYGKPNASSYLGFFAATDFASYVSKVYINRLVGPNAMNSVPSGMSPVLIKNENAYDAANLSGYSFIGRYPGTNGNGLVIDIADAAKFKTWAYKSNFTYTPGVGQYAVAVIDGSGVWTGSGANKQVEKLSVSGSAVGGTQQIQSVSFSGTASGGTQQQEILTVTGTATGTPIVVDGNNVAVTVGDTSDVVAGKIAAVLAAIPATYSSAVAVGSLVYVTFTTPAARNPIATVSSNGIGVSSSVNVAGNASFSMTVYGTTFQVTNGASATTVAAAYMTALSAGSFATNISATNSTTIKYTVQAYGPYTTVASQTIGGMTVATTVNTAGSNTITISVFGVNVGILNGDTSTTVANKIAAALIASTTFTASYSSIQATNSQVSYTNLLNGSQTAQTAPSKQASLSFYVDITTPGTLGTVLEKYELLQNTAGATLPDGTTAYAVRAINENSLYIRYGDSTIPLSAKTVTLSGAVDDYNISTYSTGLTPFYNKTQYSLKYIIAGHFDVLAQKAAIDLAATRKDCVAYVSPALSDVRNAAGNQVANITDWVNNRLDRDSTYSSRGDNWGLIYDAYNDVNRWIPAASGDAGLHAATTRDYEAWYPAAGYTRGLYKNYIKMAWSASEDDRDILFPLGVNSAVTFPDIGIVRWGDKTGTQLASNFEGENVRWAFIVAEENILSLSKKYIFELNDDFVEAQFARAIDTYLAQMVQRNAFAEYKVIVDTRNNTNLTKSQHKLIGNVLIRPLYSVRFVEITMTVVGGTMTLAEAESSILG